VLSIERFEYVRVGELLAVARLTAGLDHGRATAPSGAELAIGFGFGRYCAVSAARDVRLERRSSRRRFGGLVWSASFTVALEVLEYQAALFELVSTGAGILALPSPELREITAMFGASARGGRPVRGRARQRVATAAVTFAFTATATPAAAFAASVANTPGHAARLHPGHAARPQRAGAAGTTGAAGAVHSLSVPGLSAPKRTLTLPHLHLVSVSPHGNSHTEPVVPRQHLHAKTVVPREHVHSKTVLPPVPIHTLPVVPRQPAPAEPGAPSRPLPTPPVVRHHHAHTHPVAPRHDAAPTGGAPLVVPPSSKLGHLHGSPPHKRVSAVKTAPSQPVVTPLVPSMPAYYADGGNTAAYSRLSALLANGDQPPSFLIPIYKAAARHYHVPWRILAAINFIESDYGRNMSTSSAGAIGWMQFEPSTWAMYGANIDHRGQPNPYNPRDAIFAAARYLAASGARHNLRQAIFSYNHATWYVDEVMATAASITERPLKADARARQQLGAMRTMAHLLNGESYVWGGGHGGWGLAAGYDCSGFVSAVLHAGGYLSEPQTTETLPSQPGILPGPGQFVTIFDRTDAGIGSDHVIIDLDGQWWESGGSSAEGGRASVHRIKDMSPAYLATFNTILHPRGL
jgi:cell wall-associated NlpC family hydrolase